MVNIRKLDPQNSVKIFNHSKLGKFKRNRVFFFKYRSDRIFTQTMFMRSYQCLNGGEGGICSETGRRGVVGKNG